MADRQHNDIYTHSIGRVSYKYQMADCVDNLINNILLDFDIHGHCTSRNLQLIFRLKKAWDCWRNWLASCWSLEVVCATIPLFLGASKYYLDYRPSHGIYFIFTSLRRQKMEWRIEPWLIWDSYIVHIFTHEKNQRIRLGIETRNSAFVVGQTNIPTLMTS